jgi:hypothetical protein
LIEQRLKTNNVSWFDFNFGQDHEFEKQLNLNKKKKLNT